MAAALLTLRIAVALQCIGLFRIAYVDGTPIGTTLFMTLRWSESSMLAVDHGIAWAGLLGGLSMLWRPTRVAAGVVALWFALVAVLTAVQGGEFGATYAPFAHATRYCAGVLAFIAAMTALEPAVRAQWIERVARWACALTFAAHGLEALEANPRFIDFIITAFRRVNIEVSEPASRILLRVVGVQDMGLAALVLTKRWRVVVGYMAFWGAVTAASRVVHLGWRVWPSTLVRAANAGVPLMLMWMWRPVPADDIDAQ